MCEQSLPLNIFDFVRHPDTLNDKLLSEIQLTMLQSIYGLPLTDRQLEAYTRGTGRQVYEAKEYREATIIGGRRGGKTRLSAAIACFEAFRDHRLPRGEIGYVMLLAPTLAQAQIAFHYIRNYIQNSRVLSDRVLKITDEEIRLKNNIVIGCYACTYARVRGRTIVAAICDEIGFWSSEDSANPAEEVLAALRPAMITVSNAKLIKISTPFVKSGVLWEEFSRRNELEFLVWQATTFEMNPTVTPEAVEPERRLSEGKFRREYLAQFTDSVEAWIASEFLDLCIIRDRRELPRLADVNYVAALDAAFRGDDFALVIAHQAAEESVVVDFVTTWTGTPKAPLAYEYVLNEVKAILERYGINSITGDQFQCDPIQQYLLKVEVNFRVYNFTALSRGQLFSGLKHLLMQRRIELLDDPELNKQLRTLHEENSTRGHFDVQPSSGKDDRAVALALAVHEARSQQRALMFDIVPRDSGSPTAPLRFDPATCHLHAPCMNSPKCIDDDECHTYSPDPRLDQISS